MEITRIGPVLILGITPTKMLISETQNIWDIVYQKGKIIFRGLALFIFQGFYDICNRN